MNVLFLIGNGFDLNVGLNTCFEDALKAYLKEKTTDPRITRFKKDIDENLKKWSDFEKQLGIYTDEYNYDEIDDFCFCVKNFKESLIKHLKKEEERIEYDLRMDDIFKVFNKSIRNFYDELNDDSSKSLFRNIHQNAKNIQHNFITFNYTNILDNCLDIVSKRSSPFGKILHIHGETSKNPLMGVDNYEQIKNDKFAIDKRIVRTIIKPNINEQLKNTNNQIAENLIYSSDIICLFGLSLGETDKTWWNIIGNYWLKANVSRRLVIFDKVKPWNPIHQDEEIEKINQIEDKFCLAAGLSDAEKENITKRIHVGLNTKMFKINLTGFKISELITKS